MEDETFAQLEPFLEAYRARLSPAQRRRTSRKIGMQLRKLNVDRIAANIEPDGSPMQARKARKLSGGKGRIKRARMFRKLRLTRSFRVHPTEDGVSVGFFNAMIAATARAHQYGLVDYVGKTKDGKTVRTKYPRRRLLGFGPEDLTLITDAAIEMLEP